MLDSDLAILYGVETRVLIQGVMRNIERFPDDFMFQLDKDEFKNWRSQFVTSSWGGRRKLPHVFTEQDILYTLCRELSWSHLRLIMRLDQYRLM